MLKPRSDRGVALLLALIVVILIMGIGGAFVVETVFRGKAQYALDEGDETQAIAEAGLEKARRALFIYKRDNKIDPATGWNWNDILIYCNGSILKTPDEVEADLKPKWVSASYTNYLATRDTAAANTAVSKQAPLPQNKVGPSPVDGFPSGNCFIGWNQPYGKGFFHVLVSDNDDGDGDPLSDLDDRVKVTVTATLRDGVQRRVQILMRYPNLKANPKAAVEVDGPVDLAGGNEVDGNDYPFNGGPTPIAPGKYGISSSDSVTRRGSSEIGGNGIAPSTTPPPGTYTESDPFAPAGFYTGPDDYFKDPVTGAPMLSPGTLKAWAQQNGTYFTSKASFEAYVSSNPNAFEGQILFIEPPPGTKLGQFDLSTTMNRMPSILVVHDPTSSVEVGPIHKEFKGLLMLDLIKNLNATSKVLGAVVGFNKSGPHFGTGQGEVHFSSAVLNNLPTIQTTLLEAYRKLQPNEAP